MKNLALALTGYQREQRITAKILAKEIGIQESGLTRIKQGKKPDATNLAKIIIWLIGDA